VKDGNELEGVGQRGEGLRGKECGNRFISHLLHFMLKAVIGKTEYGFVFVFLYTGVNEENKSMVYTWTNELSVGVVVITSPQSNLRRARRSCTTI